MIKVRSRRRTGSRKTPRDTPALGAQQRIRETRVSSVTEAGGRV